MSSVVGRPVVQDTPVQDIPTPMEEEQFFPPQMDPKLEMGTAAAEAAVYDTSPPLLRNPPPIPAETAHPSALDRDQIYMIWQTTGGMNNEMKTNVQQMKEEIKKIWMHSCKRCRVRCGDWGNGCTQA